MDNSNNNFLFIKNAHENNLKNFDLKIPHNQLTVLTGLSGSGKSSLAFNTVYAEGQRRYIETFSPYTRQFFEKIKKPKADFLETVRPAIAIEQKTRILNARSTVGSLTNINHFLRIIWANLAAVHCTVCDQLLTSTDSATVLKWLKKNIKKDCLYILTAPVLLDSNELERLQVLGFSRYFDIENNVIKTFSELNLVKKNRQEVYLVFERVKGDIKVFNQHLQETIERCFSFSEGKILILEEDLDKKIKQYSFNNVAGCEKHNIKVPKAKPAMFSFNHPYGACPECRGFGSILKVDPKLCMPDESLSIKDGAIKVWEGPSYTRLKSKLINFCNDSKININKSWYNLNKTEQDLIFNVKTKKFFGLKPWFKKLEKKIYKMHVRVFMSRYRSEFICETCNGTRLKPVAAAFLLNNLKLSDLWKLPISKTIIEIEKIFELKKSHLNRALADSFKEILTRLKCLENLGLGYLTLDRQSRTLSGGEAQRVNIAAAIGSKLTHTQFVLDEPSVGLHSKDSKQLITEIQTLKNQSNSVLVVEHDPDFIRAANQVIELGPETGSKGGAIVYQGEYKNWQNQNKLYPKVLTNNQVQQSKNFLKVKNASARNLKNISIDIPLNQMVCITGVSGSGKSTLVKEVIVPEFKLGETSKILFHKEKLKQVLLVDQNPLSKTPRANIATYSGIWERIRTLYANTDQAKALKLSKSSFSFNVDAGRCKACKGAGFIKEDLQFLSDVILPCEVCKSRRFSEKVLNISYKNKNIYEILETTVSDLKLLFGAEEKIVNTCEILEKLGLGALKIGHPLSELSGGEACRLKLVPVIANKTTKETLLIFDEPTTGLHPQDIVRLLNLFKELINLEASIVCVEHNLQVIAAADWIIDLGPEGGEQGGKIVTSGTPTEIIINSNGHTAKALKAYLSPSKMKQSEDQNLKAIENTEQIEIKGAKEHNLKNLDLNVPLNKIVAFTGVSGSGKSTIAKDIIFAEGQRRYLDCLSPYARQFVRDLKKPEIESINAIPPCICVEQNTFKPSALSTLGTLSEVYNYLRLLFAKIGTQYCPKHFDQKISVTSITDLAQTIKTYSGQSIKLLAPVIRKKKGTHLETIQFAIKNEIHEVRADNIFIKPSALIEGLARHQVHDFDLVVAKLDPKKFKIDELAELVENAFKYSNEGLILNVNGKDLVLSTKTTCSICKQGVFKPDPEDFSFNSKRGACKSCNGFGIYNNNLCPDCEGTRLNNYALSVKVNNKNIAELTKLTATQLQEFLANLKFNLNQAVLAKPIMAEITARLEVLKNLGLDYIELNRSCESISSGELQRLRLAAALGSPLTGVCYVLDEPSASLHPDDTKKILQQIHHLKSKGNSVFLIEHNSDLILNAEHIIDLGPGGGAEGGQIIFNGPLNSFLESDSTTAKYLKNSEYTYQNVKKLNQEYLEIKNASKHNIKNLNLKFPLQSLVTIAGVSGAGKSTLLYNLLIDTLILTNPNKKSWGSESATITSSLPIEKIIIVDQKPIGATSRSTPALYLGIWDHIRKIFASTLEAKTLGWSNSFFSFNSGNGRCVTCKGQGEIKLELNFLNDARMLCESCQGSRFKDEASIIKYNGLSIDQILKLNFSEACKIFANHKKIYRTLKLACELGLGYLTLGQTSNTLSGGESQRIKLVYELSKEPKKHGLYILDEPSTGLHKADLSKLIAVLKRLVSLGQSVFVIEHDQDLILNSDFLVELGPGAGNNGGKIVYAGHPGDIYKYDTAWAKILSNQFQYENIRNL